MDKLMLTTSTVPRLPNYPYIGVATDHGGQAVHVVFESPGFGIQLGGHGERAVIWDESQFAPVHGALRLIQIVGPESIDMKVTP